MAKSHFKCPVVESLKKVSFVVHYEGIYLTTIEAVSLKDAYQKALTRYGKNIIKDVPLLSISPLKEK